MFRACLIRFSAVAAPLVALLAAAGLYLAIRELPSVSAIVDSRYGLLLVAKTATFAAAIALAGYHRRSVVPRVAAGAAAASVRRTLSVEAGILLSSSPWRRSSPRLPRRRKRQRRKLTVRVTRAERPVTIVALAVSVTGTDETPWRANAAAIADDSRIVSLAVPPLRSVAVAVPRAIGRRPCLGSSLSRRAVAAVSVAVTAHWAGADRPQVTASRRSAAAVARPPRAEPDDGRGQRRPRPDRQLSDLQLADVTGQRIDEPEVAVGSERDRRGVIGRSRA